MSGVVTSFMNIFRFHKMKIFAFVIFTLFFMIYLFPFDDLTDLMTTKVSEATKGSIYVQAEGMGIHWLPTPGIKLNSVVIQPSNFPNVSARELSIAPSLLSLLKGSVGARITALGLFRGDVDVHYEEAEKNKAGQPTQKIDVNASEIALQSMSQFLKDMNMGDYKLQGALSINGQAKVDPSFEEQPNANIALNIKNFVFPAYVANTPAGAFALPELKFKKSVLKSNLAEGKLQVEELTFGDEKDELNCTFKGDIVTRLSKDRPMPDFGAYSFTVDVKVLQNFYNQNSSIFMLLDQYKKTMAGGQRFTFKISAENTMGMPRITAL
jgi:type II secretion system protein N